MLETLRIENYALIDTLEVEFRHGFNVLTGETGAGKSIIVGALNLVLGGRASGDVIRDGAERAKIDALFALPKLPRTLKSLLEELDVALEDGTLLLSRTITADGRSRAYAGGALVPVSVLARIGDELVDLHGQHEHQSLLKPDRQLDLLDAFGSTEHDAADVEQLVSELRKAEQELADLEKDDRERARRVEFLRFEVSEIDNAALQSGEEEELRARRNLITNAERVFERTGSAYASLYESDGQAAIDSIDAALAALEELADVDQRFRALADQLSGIRATLDDFCGELRVFTDQVEFDPQELDALNQRISLIADLKRKFGDSIDAILAYREQAAEEVRRFEQRDQTLAELRARKDTLQSQAQHAASVLSTKRHAAAAKLAKRVSSALQDLGMKGAKFETQFETTDLTKTGVDRIEFLLAANPGERPKPLRHVASGGEISRVMLGIKTVFASADKIPTLIFDEIDAGVGGAVANNVAARLRELATSHQTICITHLPQIAAAAHWHLHVAKAVVKGRTSTSVQAVSDQVRVQELARLLDGSLSDVSLRHAAEMLKANGD
ncbi:MAG: DNA repair protein RecN [Candidatus Hydrogenedentes bacterium]|nr:DNA repair protein RecN [Candidatus Hydrogenedentota bacterium]